MAVAPAAEVSLALSDFLHDVKGGKYQGSFVFDGGRLKCGEAAPAIAASVLGSFEISCLSSFPRSDLRHLQAIVAGTNLTDATFALSEVLLLYPL